MLTLLTTNQNLICLEAHQAEIFLVDYSHTTLQLLPSWLTVTFFLFFTGLLGMMYNYRSFLVTMMSVEVMYLGAVMSFVLYSIAFKDSDAAIYALLILIFTACESAVGLGLLIVLYRFGFAVTFDAHSSLHSSTLPIATLVFAHGEGTSFFTRNLFHLASNQYMQTHFGLALYALFALLLCGLLASLAYLLSLTTSQDTEKRSEYECGFAPFDSATRLPFDVHFYLVGILFLIFDVEVALLFPWTVALSSLTWYGFFSMVGFVVVLTIGFIYEWKRGALIWPSRQRSKTSTARRFVGFLPLIMSTNYASEHAFINFIVSVQEMHNYAENLFGPLLPEMVLAGGVLLIILLMATDFARYGRKHNSRHTRLVYDDVVKLLLLVMVLVLVSLLSTTDEARLLLSGYLFTNSYTALLKLLVLVCSYVVLRAAREYVVLEKRDTLEFSIIYALAVLFLLLLVSANHLMSAFLALVGFSLNMYVLILFNARQHVSREAGIKYYYLSTFSTGFILYGMFLIYAFAKSGMFAEIDATFNAWPESLFKLRLVHFGLLLIFVGFMFKLSAFPGHLWAADVYEGSPLVVTAFFMLPVKVAVLAFFLRFLSAALSGATVIWQPWLVLAAAISMAWGALTATTAKSTLRFAAFTSINQMGFLLIGPACVTFEGYRATLSYLFIYALMSTVFLIVLVSTRLDNGDTVLYLTDLRSLGRTDWSLSWALIATVFSMAGIPPLVGFFGKYYLLIHAMESQQFILVIVALASSLISTYYYLRLVKILWFEGAEDADYTLVLGQPYSATGIIVSIAEALQWVFIITSPLLLPYATTYASNLLGQWTLPNAMLAVNTFSALSSASTEGHAELPEGILDSELAVQLSAGILLLAFGIFTSVGATVYLVKNKTIQATWYYIKSPFVSTKSAPTAELAQNVLTSPVSDVPLEVSPYTGTPRGWHDPAPLGEG